MFVSSTVSAQMGPPGSPEDGARSGRTLATHPHHICTRFGHAGACKRIQVWDLDSATVHKQAGSHGLRTWVTAGPAAMERSMVKVYQSQRAGSGLGVWKNP